jgi:hypothetical protein
MKRLTTILGATVLAVSGLLFSCSKNPNETEMTFGGQKYTIIEGSKELEFTGLNGAKVQRGMHVTSTSFTADDLRQWSRFSYKAQSDLAAKKMTVAIQALYGTVSLLKTRDGNFDCFEKEDMTDSISALDPERKGEVPIPKDYDLYKGYTAYRMGCGQADKNGDHFITDGEAEEFLNAVYNKLHP